MELVGFAMGSHTHAQFTSQVTRCFPLKELLIYPGIIYSAHPGSGGQAWLGGLLTLFADAPYESVNGRLGVELVDIQSDCEWANLREKILHGSVSRSD